ncbi:MAG TPA: biopolymer transporter ExbD [Kofleriaceae bacterium]|nr:biopolymer transporter ExbD [Kofleriaceae bacterium]
MAGNIDTGKKGAVNVDINVVPFIDLMSCLTAFLLVTAVWSQFKQISIRPKGLGREADKVLQEEPPPKASILITKSELWIGLTLGDRQQILNNNENPDPHDYDALLEVLKSYKEMPVFAERYDIEIAAEDEVTYQNVINTMDRAVISGFTDVGFVDPASLSVKFKE